MMALCSAYVTVATAQMNPIVGKWQWTRKANNCIETYDYRVDGTLRVVSGAEVSEHTYSISMKPDDKGLYVLKGQMTKTNGGKDCSDSPSSAGAPPCRAPMSLTAGVSYELSKGLHLDTSYKFTSIGGGVWLDPLRANARVQHCQQRLWTASSQDGPAL